VNTLYHGFVRARDGGITTFDAPGAGTNQYEGTLALSINPAGVITGLFVDANNVHHGFLRVRDGTIRTFDFPRSTSTDPSSINPAATITGFYFRRSFVAHGFLRTINHPCAQASHIGFVLRASCSSASVFGPS